MALAVASGDLTVAQFAEALNARPHAVRYALQRLESSGELSRWVFVDRQRLGLTAYNMYFNIHAPAVEAVKKFLLADPYVQWFGQTAGHRRFEATIWVSSAHELSTFFDRLGEKCGAHFTDRTMAIEGDTWHWGHRCFSERFARFKPFHFQGSDKPYPLDDLDWRIINGRRRPDVWEASKIARLLGEPVSTITFRINRLLRDRIIHDSYILRRDFSLIHEGHLLLEVRAHSKGFLRKLLNLCQHTATVGGLIRSDGDWDFKVVMFGEGNESLLEAEDTFRRELSGDLERVTFVLRRSLIKSAATIPPRGELASPTAPN